MRYVRGKVSPPCVVEGRVERSSEGADRRRLLRSRSRLRLGTMRPQDRPGSFGPSPRVVSIIPLHHAPPWVGLAVPVVARVVFLSEHLPCAAGQDGGCVRRHLVQPGRKRCGGWRLRAPPPRPTRGDGGGGGGSGKALAGSNVGEDGYRCSWDSGDAPTQWLAREEQREDIYSGGSLHRRLRGEQWRPGLHPSIRERDRYTKKIETKEIASTVSRGDLFFTTCPSKKQPVNGTQCGRGHMHRPCSGAWGGTSPRKAATAMSNPA